MRRYLVKKSAPATIPPSVLTTEEDPFIEYLNITLTPEQIQKRELFLQRTQPDLLLDVTSRKRLYVLLIDSAAVQGISELDIFDKTSIAENFLSKIRDIDMEFKFCRFCLEKLTPYLFQVVDWEELRPIFKMPYISYQGCLDNLIEDLRFNQSLHEVAGSIT